MLEVQIITGVISVFFLATVFEAIRRKKLMEKYAVLWIFSCLIMLVFSIFPQLLFKISEILGVFYLTVLVLFSVLFLLSIILHFSISLSQLSENNKKLAQEIGLMKLKLEKNKDEPKNKQNTGA